MKHKRFIFLILSFWFCATGWTQNISLRNIPILKQLPNATVTRLLQDSESFLWLGTPEGLYRYDGYRVLTFKADAKNPKLLTDNDITALSEADKYLWIGTKKGVNILDKSTCKITVLSDSVLF